MKCILVDHDVYEAQRTTDRGRSVAQSTGIKLTHQKRLSEAKTNKKTIKQQPQNSKSWLPFVLKITSPKKHLQSQQVHDRVPEL